MEPGMPQTNQSDGVPMTQGQPLTEHQRAIVRHLKEIADAHNVVLSTEQYRAALELIGEVNILDVSAAVSLLKMRKGFPFPVGTWNPIKEAIAQKMEERLRQEQHKDKATASQALRNIDKRIKDEGMSDTDRESIMARLDDYWATHGGRPAPKPPRRVPAAISEHRSPSKAGVPPAPAGRQAEGEG